MFYEYRSPVFDNLKKKGGGGGGGEFSTGNVMSNFVNFNPKYIYIYIVGL